MTKCNRRKGARGEGGTSRDCREGRVQRDLKGGTCRERERERERESERVAERAVRDLQRAERNLQRVQ